MGMLQVPTDHTWQTDALLPVGQFRCEVESVTVGASKSSHSPQAAVKLKCVEGGENEGKVTFDYVPLLPNTLFRLTGYGVAAGLIDPEDPAGSTWGPGKGIDTDALNDVLCGAEVLVTVGEEEYEGKKRVRPTRVDAL